MLPAALPDRRSIEGGKSMDLQELMKMYDFTGKTFAVTAALAL